jgi:hypothetical protein
MDAKDFGLVKGASFINAPPGSDMRMLSEPTGEMLSAQSLPERAAIVRLGRSWVKCTDAVACVTAIPTTTAPHTFWNADSRRSMIIDRVSWQCSTSAGAASMFSLLGMLNVLPVAAQPSTTDTATGITGLSGKANGSSVKSSHTVTVVNDQWFPLGQIGFPGALTATVGAQIDTAINGLIIVPPLSLLSFAVVAANTTAVGKISLFWHDVELQLA